MVECDRGQNVVAPSAPPEWRGAPLSTRQPYSSKKPVQSMVSLLPPARAHVLSGNLVLLLRRVGAEICLTDFAFSKFGAAFETSEGKDLLS